MPSSPTSRHPLLREGVRESSPAAGAGRAIGTTALADARSSAFYPFLHLLLSVLALPLLPLRVWSALFDLFFPRLSVCVLRSCGRKGRGGGGKTERAAHFNLPADICLSSDNSTLYVSDANNHRIHVMEADTGALLRSIGRRGSGAGQFNFPYSLALYDDRILFVCDFSNSRVQMIDVSTGGMLCELPVDGESPKSCSVASTRRLLYLAIGHHIVVVTFDPSAHTMQVTSHISLLHVKGAVSSNTSRSLHWPTGLCIGGSREQLLYCADVHFEEGHPMLLCIDMEADHGSTLLYSAVPEFTDKVHRRIEPKSIRLSPCGRHLFLSDSYRGRLLVYSAHTGRYLAQTSSGRLTGEGSPKGFCFSRSSHYQAPRLFVCNSSKHRIDVIEVTMRWPWSSHGLVASFLQRALNWE